MQLERRSLFETFSSDDCNMERDEKISRIPLPLKAHEIIWAKIHIGSKSWWAFYLPVPQGNLELEPVLSYQVNVYMVVGYYPH